MSDHPTLLACENYRQTLKRKPKLHRAYGWAAYSAMGPAVSWGSGSPPPTPRRSTSWPSTRALGGLQRPVRSSGSWITSSLPQRGEFGPLEAAQWGACFEEVGPEQWPALCVWVDSGAHVVEGHGCPGLILFSACCYPVCSSSRSGVIRSTSSPSRSKPSMISHSSTPPSPSSCRFRLREAENLSTE